MCHHHDLRDWESLREELAESGPDEPTDEAAKPADEPKPRERTVYVPPADD